MKDEWIYDSVQNLIYRKRDRLTDEKIEELRTEEARQEEWIKKQNQDEEEGDED